MKVWSPLDKRISLPKVWSQKCFQYQKSTMPCPKSKFSTFIRFLSRYWQNPESLVTIGQTHLSPQIWVPKRFPVPAGPKNQNWATTKKYHLGITLKIPETLEFNLGNVIRTTYAAPKFVTDRQTDKQTDRQTDRHSQILAQLKLRIYNNNNEWKFIQKEAERKISL